MMARGNMFQMWTWMASFGFLTMLQQFIPREYTDKLRRSFTYLLERLSPYIFCDVPEFADSQSNALYQDVQMYISSLKVEGAHRVSITKPKGSKAMTFALAHEQRTLDNFDGCEMEWVHRVSVRPRPLYTNYFENQSDEKRKYTLQIKRKDKERVLDAYMKHIEVRASEQKLADRHLRLYTNTNSRHDFRRRSPWQSVPFLPPANFDTLALDGDLKSRILADLDHFAANEQYYKRVGKAWKRGYLLFGPPGTGKSSMIAAIANKMRYDVYDLELTEVHSNAELRTLLLETSNKSVIVIEDIDCSQDLSGQRKKKKKKSKPPVGPDGRPLPPGAKPPEKESKVTLSGLLNFVDGLWSSCGSERIFIFTTNYKEKLDPALLRAGRMDMHVHLGYCTFSAFKTLALTYLQVTEHELFEKLETAFVGSFMTPAEVTEVIIQNQNDNPSVALERLIVALGEHRVDPSTLKTSEEDEDDDDDEPQDEKTELKNSSRSSQKEVQVVEKKPIPVKSSAAADSKSGEIEPVQELETKITDSSRNSQKDVEVVEEKKPIVVRSSAAADSKSGEIEIVQEPEIQTKEAKLSKDMTPFIDGPKTESQKDAVVKAIPDATAVSGAKQEPLNSSETQANDTRAAQLQAPGEKL